MGLEFNLQPQFTTYHNIIIVDDVKFKSILISDPAHVSLYSMFLDFMGQIGLLLFSSVKNYPISLILSPRPF